jgi:multidrug efflux pump subunit AcrB
VRLHYFCLRFSLIMSMTLALMIIPLDCARLRRNSRSQQARAHERRFNQPAFARAAPEANEGVGADQTLLGRIFGYGTITVIGKGGTKETYVLMSNPLEFRRQAQGAIRA